MFWGRIEESDILNNPSVPKVILSSGGSDSRSKGFSFFYDENDWTLRVSDGPQIWMTIISRNQIPLGKWFSFAFTWKKSACHDDERHLDSRTMTTVGSKFDLRFFKYSKKIDTSEAPFLTRKVNMVIFIEGG